MRILVIGAGGVGAAAGALAASRAFVDDIVLADFDEHRAVDAAKGASTRSVRATCSGRFVDASSTSAVEQLVKATNADAVLNACDPRLNPAIFAGVGKAGATYVDMAMTLSERHPTEPFAKPGVMLGDAQFAEHEAWRQRGQLAMVGLGVEPGLSDVFARYAADNLFRNIHEVGVRDGSNLVVDGFDFAPTFSIWTVIEECLNPPLLWERERGWFCTQPFSEPETFDFPGGIGATECVNVEHEEVVLVPRWIDCERVTFKYGLGDEFIEVLRTLDKLGLSNVEPVNVRGQRVSPRDVVAACLPDPRTLGDRMHGVTCAGTWVNGTGADGQSLEVYLYHLADNQRTWAEWGHQAVVWQTAINPIIGLELLSDGRWSGAGVLGPEAFPAEPFLELLGSYGSPHGVRWRRPNTGWVEGLPPA